MALQNEKNSRYLLRDWKPENPAFWENKGKHIARRNLWISVSCLLLAFCVWMLFSAVTVNLNKIGFNFTTDQLFLLTALPSVSGALLRVPYSFMVPIFGGRRWTVFSTAILIIPCVWLGIAVQNPNTPFGIFIVIALLCGFAGANFASSMGNISFFFPKAKQGSALGINGGLGNLGVSVMQLVAPLVIFVPVFAFLGVNGVPQADGSVMSLANAAWIWVPLLAIATIAAWSGMNDIASSRASIADQLPVLQRLHLWLLSLLYLATFGSFIGFSAGFAMLAKTQFPDVNILRLAFFGPFIGAIARSVGGAISDKFGGVRVTLINFIFMAIFSALLFLTLPGTGSGNFIAFYAVFMGLFLTAGLGSGSTFQMIAVIFRQITIYRVKMKGGSDEQAQREAVTETAAALGFISAIGAVGGFFIPQAFGMSLNMTGSPVGAMKVFLIFYIVCVLLTWLVYGRRKFSQNKRSMPDTSYQATTVSHQIPIHSWSRSYVMSKLLDRFRYFKQKGETFADGHGQVMHSNRDWEDSYRQRWQFDKIVRSTHGVNCTGSCSWKIYVKNGLVTWEIQQTDYPRTRPDLPNHEPRGCPRGASYSWYLYSANRLKYPLIRKRLIELWREALKQHSDPVLAWASIMNDPQKSLSYKQVRGRGGFIRSNWQELNQLIAAANVWTIKTYGPDRVAGFSPIPAMSMVSYAAGTRYLSLLGGTCLSFYDWYCDLPPASPMTWGEQTDVPESADWYNSSYIIAWGSNVPQTRTPDAHFFTEVRYKGTKTIAITPDYSEVAKLCDQWLAPKQGTDSALAMAMGHVILKEFHLDNPSDYFINYCRRYSDMPMLVMLEPRDDGSYVPGRMVRASDLVDGLGESNNPQWKTVAVNTAGELVVPNGSIGFRWGEKGKWNLESIAAGTETELSLTLLGQHDAVAGVAFPYFGGIENPHFRSVKHNPVLVRQLPVKNLTLADGTVCPVVSVYDLVLANYGLDRGLEDENSAKDYAEIKPYTPAWGEQITGVPRQYIETIAREFADTAHKTHGRSMIILGAGVNHWYHMDMNYRGMINMLIFCGCVGQSGGGWAHYVGQEKLRPQTGWLPLAFALDWNRPPRQMNSTSFFYNHSSQWRYEKVTAQELLSPLADASKYSGHLIDFNVRAERMGWLPSAPQLGRNPLSLKAEADKAGLSPTEFTAQALKSGDLRMACEQPDSGSNHPRNLFVWRSNLLGSSGKGHEYMQKYLLGTESGIQGEELGASDGIKPEEVEWQTAAIEGKLDLLVTLDFRMSSTCLFSDIVLPTATWYEKDDMNTSDMHPFIHPLSAAVDPAWESRSDWEIYKGIAKAFSQVCIGHLGKETDVVLQPLLHDSPAELSQPCEVLDWRKGECDLIPGKTAPNIVAVERDYPATYERFTSLGPLMDKLGNGGKGISWNTQDEIDFLGKLNYTKRDGPAKGRPLIDTAIDASEVILALAPETNGHVAAKAWQALGEITGREHTHLALHKEDEKIRFRDIQAQPRKIISSPTWSGLESDHVSYNAGYTNVHELIPWRTLSGRQQLYQDHPWMRAFGESLVAYRPPIDTRSVSEMRQIPPNGFPEKALNFLTPHQKWGIHSTYSENLLMLTLSRGGPIVWISETDARELTIVDNDWVEVFNANGALTARAVVSQRVPPGMTMMYHAQERIMNIPGSEVTGMRGGIHNSVTRVCPKPTHMIGGYAQLAWGFNYYGTVGSNRDEFIMIRKMKNVNWLDDEGRDQVQEAKK